MGYVSTCAADSTISKISYLNLRIDACMCIVCVQPSRQESSRTFSPPHPLCVCILLLLPPPPSLFLPSFSTVQGQLENIPCSFLAQTRHSPGPLIKHKPSLFLSFFLPPSSLSLSALSPLSICLACIPPNLPLPPPFLPQPLSIISSLFPLFSLLSPGPLIPRPLCLFVTVEVWYSHWDSLQSQSVQSARLVILFC